MTDDALLHDRATISGDLIGRDDWSQNEDEDDIGKEKERREADEATRRSSSAPRTALTLLTNDAHPVVSQRQSSPFPSRYHQTGNKVRAGSLPVFAITPQCDHHRLEEKKIPTSGPAVCDEEVKSSPAVLPSFSSPGEGGIKMSWPGPWEPSTTPRRHLRLAAGTETPGRSQPFRSSETHMYRAGPGCRDGSLRVCVCVCVIVGRRRQDCR